ncbi:MAG: bifunctional pyr operon transcriptional regulator/uracil phosphoribosyltransferase PyrR [Fibrobacterales bacterium]
MPNSKRDSFDGVTLLEQIMDSSAIDAAIHSCAVQITNMPDYQQVVLMGNATRGIPLAERIGAAIEKQTGVPIEVGSLDASFYRDDFHYRIKAANPQMKITTVPQSIAGKRVILVDDVLYTGRSVRAAMNAIFDLGRPASIGLVVLIDRGCRELPICPDFSGKEVVTEKNQEVRVKVTPVDDEDAVWLVEVKE